MKLSSVNDAVAIYHAMPRITVKSAPQSLRTKGASSMSSLNEVLYSEWRRFLDEFFCDENLMTGNRPCDDGAPCDRCLAESLTQQFKDWRQQQNAIVCKL